MLADRRRGADAGLLTRLSSWQASLPPDGWEGTSHEPGDELAAFGERHRLVAFVPLCPGWKVGELNRFCSANGFALNHCRAKHARILRVIRHPPAEGTQARRNRSYRTDSYPC